IQLSNKYTDIIDVSTLNRCNSSRDIIYYNNFHDFAVYQDFELKFGHSSRFMGFGSEVFICYLKNYHSKKSLPPPPSLNKYYGIPQHFGMFYACGGALIMEGLLSGCYHICPNNANYQFE
ncbi:unnamed protein product, partial [Meganyctiphanes norvegica]